MAVELTAVHFAYVAFVVATLAFMYFKKDTVLLTIIGIFVVGIMITGSVIGGAQGVFNAIYQAAIGMFVIPILIAVIYALSTFMKETGADYIMISPLKSLMGRPVVSYWFLGIIMFVLALFFWPTPASGLVGCILVPVAVGAGMSPLMAAVPLAMFGHGGALSGDWVLQGAPTILAKSSGLPIGEILSTSTIIVGGSLLAASITAFLMYYKELTTPYVASAAASETAAVRGAGTDLHPVESCDLPNMSSYAKFYAILVPVALAIDVAIMVSRKFIGGDATALLGGTVFVLMVIMSLIEYKGEALTKLTENLKCGFIFAIEIFAPVFVIAAFFSIGSPEGAALVFGKGAPGCLVDIGQTVASVAAINKGVLAVVQAVVSGMTGLDGAGFDQLPLVGSLARSLAPAIGANPVPLACLGQMTSIWTAGALTPWGFLAALAAFVGVDPVELARKNFFPTMVGFATGTVITVFLM